MTLLWIPLLTVLGTFVPPLTIRLGRSACALLTATPPAIALGLVVREAPTILQGDTVSYSMPWIPALGLDLSFRLDGLAFLFALLVLGIGLLIILYARYYLSRKDSMARFYVYLILFMTAMLGIVISGNLIQMWFFWELTSVSSFLLIAFWHHKSAGRKGARMALTITGMGGLAMLAGVLLIGKAVGSYDLAVVLSSGDLLREHSSYPAIMLLILLGAFTKSAQFPFHFWLPHAMAAPTPVSAYLHSATMVKAGIFLMARLFPVLSGTELWFMMVSTTGLLTLLVGAYMAIFKHDLKGLLAYSTVSHLGLITLLLGVGTRMAAVGAVFHIINHAAFKASLFMVAGIIDHESGTRDMRKINGLRKFMPYTAVFSMLAAASMAGIPPMNGFLSKEMFLAETLGQQSLGSLSWMIPVLATIGAGLSVAYSLRFVHDVFYNGEPRDLPKTPHEPPHLMRLPVELLVLLCLAIGLFPTVVVGDLLGSASLAVIGGELPEYHLHLWHGFNLPLLMSGLAIAGGGFVYYHRQRLFQFQAQFPEGNASIAFDRVIGNLVKHCRNFVQRVENGSMQRYVFFMVLMAMLLLGSPLFNLDATAGLKTRIPVDSVSLSGAGLLAFSALATVIWRNRRLIALLLLSVVGLIVSLFFALYSAPDLALTQLSVEVVTTVLLLLALYFLPDSTPSESSPRRLVRDFSLAAVVGGVVGTICYALMTRPLDTISEYYIQNSKSGGGGTNVVNVILVDFRGFDTMGEITVLGIAALGIYKLIVGTKLFKSNADESGRPWAEDKHPMMLRIVAQGILPLALLVSVFIFLRGHNLPGGGFIAGLVTAIALILQYIALGSDWINERLPIDYQKMIGFGLLIAVCTGLGSWVFGHAFLKSWHGYVHWPVVGEFELASAAAFDLGVYFTVIGATLLILSKLGQHTTAQRVRETEHR